MTGLPDSFTRGEVTARGFEARCVIDDCVEYLWHRGYGLRADQRERTTTLITDPAALPDGPWQATALGSQELRDPSLLEPARDPHRGGRLRPRPHSSLIDLA